MANAIAYTPNGGTVALTAAQQDSEVRIEITDSGIGIAAEHLHHLFEKTGAAWSVRWPDEKRLAAKMTKA